MELSDTTESCPIPPASADLWVICLCAQWCHICRDLRSALTNDGRLPLMVKWRWVDVEDDADLLGDLDVEAFPTYLIGQHGQVLQFAPGPTQTDAILSFVTPYVSGRIGATPVSQMPESVNTHPT